MAAPIIFAGNKAKLLTSEGLLLGSGRTIDYDGPVNYIANPGAELNTNGWATYADAAGAVPVDGTAGTANITWTRSTTTPLRGAGHFLLTKDAVNRQGQGVSYDFAISNADQGKVLQIGAEFQVMSGTFADNDAIIYIRDLTNNVNIEPVGFQIKNAAGPVKLKATFQTASNSTSYRLIIHVASASASAYTLAFDSLEVAPQRTILVSMTSDTQAWSTLTSAGFGTTTDTKLHWRQSGDRFEAWGRFTTGTVSATLASLTLPNGHSVSTDPNKISASNEVVGKWWRNTASGTTVKNGVIIANNASGTTVNFSNDDWNAAQTPATPQNGNAIAASTQDMYVSFSVPIQGWGSNVTAADAGDGRVFAARYTTATAGSYGSNTTTILDFTTKSHDTHLAVTTGAAWKFTAQQPGYYDVDAEINFTGATAGGYVALKIYKNGAEYSTGPTFITSNASYEGAGISDQISLNAGDYIDVRLWQSGGGTLNLRSDASFNHIAITKVQGPSAIAAGETVACRYTTTAGAAIANSVATVIYGTKEYDTHGSYNSSTGVFTAPVAGKYAVKAAVCVDGVTLSTTQIADIYIFKGATEKSVGRLYGNGSAITPVISVADTIDLLAGETILIKTFISVADVLSTSAGRNWLVIERIGN